MESEETNIPAQPEAAPAPDVKKPRATRRTTTRKAASTEATTAPEADGGSTEAPAAKVKKTTVRKPRAAKASPTAASAEDVSPAAVSEPASTPASEGEKPDARTRVRRVSLKPREATEEASAPAAVPTPAPAPSTATPAAEQSAEHPATPDAEAPAAPSASAAPSTTGSVRPAPHRQDEHHTHTRDIREREEERDLEGTPGFTAPETVGGNEGGGNGSRRKRRRRNRRGGEGSPQVQQGSNPRVDPDELVRRAWKIYLGEVTEEGLALMDDRTATEASRRAFRVAELFLLEAARHRPSTTEEAPAETSDEEE